MYGSCLPKKRTGSWRNPSKEWAGWGGAAEGSQDFPGEKRAPSKARGLGKQGKTPPQERESGVGHRAGRTPRAGHPQADTA